MPVTSPVACWRWLVLFAAELSVAVAWCGVSVGGDWSSLVWPCSDWLRLLPLSPWLVWEMLFWRVIGGRCTAVLPGDAEVLVGAAGGAGVDARGGRSVSGTDRYAGGLSSARAGHCSGGLGRPIGGRVCSVLWRS